MLRGTLAGHESGQESQSYAKLQAPRVKLNGLDTTLSDLR
jgi:hypothetical protein